jgi:hypothetical protein
MYNCSYVCFGTWELCWGLKQVALGVLGAGTGIAGQELHVKVDNARWEGQKLCGGQNRV